MKDPHLNLFYSYNRDSELIENNLTRAWIVTLRMLSVETRGLFLKTLLERPLRELGKYVPSFIDCQFALQNHMEKELIKRLQQKFVITVATSREINNSKFSLAGEDNGDSIPDAWIFDPEQGYCFLVESKVGSNPINAKQIQSHLNGWLIIPSKQITQHLIALTWYDVLSANQRIGNHLDNPQERLIIEEFSQYLSLFGYRLFIGFDFSPLPNALHFALIHHSANGTGLLDFSQVQATPVFCLGNVTN